MPDNTPTYSDSTVITDVDGTNEVQRVTITADGGTFTLSYEGETTDAIAHNATPDTVESELAELAVFNAADVSVSGVASDHYDVTFQGQYAATNVPPLTADGGELDNGEAQGTAVVTVVTSGVAVEDSQAVQIPDGANDGRGLTSTHDPAINPTPVEQREDDAEAYGD